MKWFKWRSKKKMQQHLLLQHDDDPQRVVPRRRRSSSSPRRGGAPVSRLGGAAGGGAGGGAGRVVNGGAGRVGQGGAGRVETRGAAVQPWISKLPPPVLQRIFQFVCPHALDESYETCEQSAGGDACMLCDLRDLAHCAQVSRRWRAVGVNVLYHSIRIDPVHYCAREDMLAEKRKRRSFMNRNAEPEDTPQVRLRLLCRTLRDQEVRFAPVVQFLKTPYMTRETCRVDLARIVSVLPNLRYVDLPEGLFVDEPSCLTLRQEVQARCPDIRKMSYMGGSERSLELLAGKLLWRNLEVLELARLNMDPTALLGVLGSLPQLRALKMTDMKILNDKLFQQNDFLAPIPPLTELILENTPQISAQGLVYYLARPETKQSLQTLSLSGTGVHPATLQVVLATAPCLRHVSLIESASHPFPVSHTVPPLSSKSLESLHYEITSGPSANAYVNTTSTYYSYLSNSLISNGLPNLRSLYVRDPDFLDSLLDLAPPKPAFASDPDKVPGKHLSSNNPFSNKVHSNGLGLQQELEVYSKGIHEEEWNFTHVQPSNGAGSRSGSARGSMISQRPLSSYGLAESVEKTWAEDAGARRSVVVANGQGGFLAVPGDCDDRRRHSSSSGKRSKLGPGGRGTEMWPL